MPNDISIQTDHSWNSTLKDLPIFAVSTQSASNKVQFVPWLKGSNATFWLLQGFATSFVLNAAMENGGRFTDDQVDQLRRLEEGGGGVVPQKCNCALVH